jgi:hypothetical protein
MSNPAIQGGAAPFLVGLVTAVALQPLRLSGLAVVTAFLACVYLVSGFQFSPLTATRKIVLVGLAAPVLGWAVDYRFRQSPGLPPLLAAAAIAATLWAFWPVLATKPAGEASLMGLVAILVVGFLIAFGQIALAADGVRAGSAALALGVGVGVAAVFSASASYGLYGIAIGAGAGAFLLPQMILGRKQSPCATFTLPAMLLAGLVAAATMILARLPWYSMLVLGLVPLAARIPTPRSTPVWLEAVLSSVYGLIVAGAACALAWPSSHQP